MFNKIPVLVIFTTFIMFFSSNLMASGGSYSGGGASYGSSSSAKKVDPAYENGKAIYNGRSGGKKVSYCIADGSNSVAVKRSSIKQLKEATYANVGERLFNCENSNETMNLLLTKYELNSVAYYLNKRYRLRLSRS